MKNVYLLFVLIISLQNVSSARILAVALFPSYSHQFFYQPLWRELALRGHDVVVVTTDPTNETLPNFKEISIKEAYIPMKEISNTIINTSFLKLMWENTWMESLRSLTEFQLNLPQFQQLINNKTEQFDLLMIEHFITPAFGLQHRFQCPMIGVMSLDALSISHEMMGNADNSLLYPPPIFPFEEELTLIDRLVSLIFEVISKYSQYSFYGKMTETGRKYFGNDMPPIGELFERTDMLFINANPVLNKVRPITPSTISYTGGMHIKTAKPLPQELQHFLDSAHHGAIYFSLGSNVKSNELTMDFRQTIMDTFKKLPYKILWKFEDDTLPGKPNNVMIIKWAPQQDVLRHKNVKLFITQGGVQSLEESLYSHVPNIVMPFVGDQFGNAAKIRNKGLGLIVDKHNLQVEDFKAAILEVLENPKYRKASKQFSTQIKDSPLTPLENAVWWTEYVLRHKGAQHLKGPRIPFYQHYYLDVLFVLVTLITIIFGIIIAMVLYSIKGIRYLFSTNTKKEMKTQKVKTT